MTIVNVERIGVVGCGTMGSGIAQACAQAGYSVTIAETSEELLSTGLSRLEAFLEKGVARGKLDRAEAKQTRSRVTGTTELRELGTSDLVIEAVPENLELKREVFKRLDEICAPDCILATNTSVLSVLAIAAATNRQERVVGTHFFNPAPVMKLVEIVRTIASSDEVIDDARRFVESLGKHPVLAPDTPGFIVNRLLTPFLLEAIRMLEAGLTTKEDLDTAVKLGLGHPMGPIELNDLAGLDTTYFATQYMYEETKERSLAPPTLLKQMVLAGRTGRKAGRGFYDYTDS